MADLELKEKEEEKQKEEAQKAAIALKHCKKIKNYITIKKK